MDHIQKEAPTGMIACFKSKSKCSVFAVIVEKGGAQWAKSGGEAFLLQFSDFTKDPMHDFNRLFC